MNKKTLTIAILSVLLFGCDKLEPSNTDTASQEEQIDPIEKKVEEQVRKYDERVTTYNPSNYKLPQSSLSTTNHKVACNFGVGEIYQLWHQMACSHSRYIVLKLSRSWIKFRAM